jgi:hypothetical protein
MSSPARYSVRSFSPHATFGQVAVSGIRKALQQQWQRWGRPETLRVDNGVPWGNGHDLPTPFALWVFGLGMRLHWNDPCCPQQNPKIECSQGTGKRWAEPGQCTSVAQLQANLDEADRVHREEYPTASGPSRLELFPGLRHSGRAYTVAWEARAWCLGTVEAQLAEYVATRKVAATGHVSVYDHGRYVGKQYQGQYVQVQYDPDRHQWLISDQQGRIIRHHLAPEITHEEIIKFNFRKKRKKP